MKIKTYKIRGLTIYAAVPNEYFESNWRSVEEGVLESAAYSVFDCCVDRDTVCFDLGAYIGFTCCYLAKISKITHAFEPDPEAFRILDSTAAANSLPNLHIYPVAVGEQESTAIIMSAYSGGNSGSSLMMRNPKSSWEVRMIDICRFIDVNVGGGKVFMKIDIEGYEYRLLRVLIPNWRRHKATVFLALHPQILSSMMEGNNCWAKIQRRIYLLLEHLPLLRAHFSARQVYFASGASAHQVILHILIRILLKGNLPADRKEIVLQF